MSTALFAAPGVLAPVQGLWRWFMHGTAPHRSPQSRGDLPVNEVVRQSIAHHGACPSVESQNQTMTPVRRPLRIVRILEADQASANVGRMVISGRMADVCAELDRLAAREAALH